MNCGAAKIEKTPEPNLTLTRVVFESVFSTSKFSTAIYLTLTRVVFELQKCFYVLKQYSYLTLTRVVFEWWYDN